MTLEFELKANGHEITRFEACRRSTHTLSTCGPHASEREVGHYEWAAWRGASAISSGELDHFTDMGIEYLAWLVLQEFWEDQVSRLMAEHKRMVAVATPMTRYEAEQEITRGRATGGP